jgi:2-polyprenyl-3-methyl-5-hydroxy-6-metoxy-1,4-benzoquinol methylase
MPGVPHGVSVEEWNDDLAREHDIDEYYARANPAVRVIERIRLRRVRSLLSPAAGERLLEVGCGGGHVLERFPECDLVGVDVSGAMLEKARRRLEGFRVELLKGELTDLQLEPVSFDAAICTEVLEHVVDPESVLASIASLVRPGGRAVVTFPNDVLIGRTKALVRRCGVGRLPPFRGIDWGGDQYHLHTWTARSDPLLLPRAAAALMLFRYRARTTTAISPSR